MAFTQWLFSYERWMSRVGILGSLWGWMLLLFLPMTLAFLPCAQAAFVSEHLLLDGRINNVRFKCVAGVWRGGVFQENLGLNAMAVGDILAGVIKATRVNMVPESSFEGEMTGYFAMRVTTAITDWGVKVYEFGAAGSHDPFGRLSGEESLRVYLDITKDFSPSEPPLGGSRDDDVVAATDGQLFASFGFGYAIDRSFGGAPDPGYLQGLAFNAQSLSLKGGLSLKALGPGFEWLIFPGVSSGPWESVYSALYSERLVRGGNALAPWAYGTPGGDANNVLVFRAIPEPNSAILGVLGVTSALVFFLLSPVFSQNVWGPIKGVKSGGHSA